MPPKLIGAQTQRMRIIGFPVTRPDGLRAKTASSSFATLPMFLRSRPSRTRWTISPSWPRSDSTTKSIARPSLGRASTGPTTDTSVPPDRIRPAERRPISPPMTSNGRAADRTALDVGAHEFVDLEHDAVEDVGGVDLVLEQSLPRGGPRGL